MPSRTEPQPVVELMDGEDLRLATIQDQPTQLFQAILTAVGKGGMDPKAMEDLYAFHQRIKADQARESFLRAMKAAQEEMGPVVKNAKGENGKYANIEAIDRAIRPIYQKHGFTLSFGEGDGPSEGKLELICKCFHEDGHTEIYRLRGALDLAGPKGQATKTGIQALGSSNSYLIRYLTRNIFNVLVVEQDNDGASTKTITQEQADTINTMLNDCGMTDKAKRAGFYAWAEISNVADLPAHKYEKAVVMLQSKARQMK